MYIGAAYYPELWDLTEVKKDVERCHAYGINVLRVGEFAWSRMEPEEGKFDLDWLQTVIDELHAGGISTILCTPTCTPPRWLFRKYPEARMVLDGTGERTDVFSRCHTCKTSPVLREKNRAVVTALAERFGSHPGVMGWQIDNEFYVYKNGCHCPLCKQAFRERLKERYGTVEALNRAWGMYRWSLDYESFDQIEPPRCDRWEHPSLKAEWWRFQAAQIKSFSDEQAAVIHRWSKAPVGTDMMPNNKLSYYEMTEHLDVVQYNHYDRAEKLPDTAFFYDFIRPVKPRPFWVTETQVGWNGSHFARNGYRPEGNCYANTWLPVAMGAEANCYWLFRAHPNGHEIAHGAVFSACGQPYRVSDEVRRASDDMKKCEAFLRGTRVRADVALHCSALADVNFEQAPILADNAGEPFAYRPALAARYHAAFRHRNLDVIDTPHALDGYRVVLSPFLSHIDAATEAKIRAFVENGGTWIAGPMTDVMTADLSRYTNSVCSFLEDFAGTRIRYQIPIGNDVFTAQWADGTPAAISTCYDALEPVNSRTLLTYADHEFKGFAAVTERKVGKGRVILCGTVLSHADLLRLVDLPAIAQASENVRLVERSDANGPRGFIAVEVEDRPGEVTLPAGSYRDLITGAALPDTVPVNPYQVLVLEKE